MFHFGKLDNNIPNCRLRVDDAQQEYLKNYKLKNINIFSVIFGIAKYFFFEIRWIFQIVILKKKYFKA